MKRLILTIVLSSFLAVIPTQAMSPEAAMQKVAEASGLSGWDTVESIAYTFNVKLPNKLVERSWEWWPKVDKVAYTEAGADTVTYQRGESADPKIDQKFINDLYWLAFPFVVVWDDTVTLKTLPKEEFKAGIEAAGAIEVIYPEGVGYTPGDVYEVYYDANYLMTHWVFRRGGGEELNNVSTWAEYAEFGPLNLSTDHKAYPEGAFHLYFTNVTVVAD
jgi:hypothetical protein